MKADLSGIVYLLTTVANWFKNTYVVFGGVPLSLWSIFVSGSAAAIITRVLFGESDKDDD